jgi:hypothetical protein
MTITYRGSNRCWRVSSDSISSTGHLLPAHSMVVLTSPIIVTIPSFASPYEEKEAVRHRTSDMRSTREKLNRKLRVHYSSQVNRQCDPLNRCGTKSQSSVDERKKSETCCHGSMSLLQSQAPLNGPVETARYIYVTSNVSGLPTSAC